MGSIKVQDLYRSLVTESGGIAASGDVNFTLSSAPRYTNGFLVIEPDSTTNRETVYFHNVVGNRVYVRGVNRKSPKFHAVSATVQMNDVEEIFNFYADMASPLFYVEKTGSLNVNIWGGTVLVNRTQVTIPDTALTLTDNTTNYIVYDYLTNTVSANTTGTGLIKATVVTVSGIITSTTYNVIKESYADPYVPDISLVAPYVQNQSWVYATSTGSANAYVLTLSPAITAYSAGQMFSFKANFSNTGASTINVNGKGAKSIKKLDGVTDLVSGDIVSGQIVEVIYDGTNFQMISVPTTLQNLDIHGKTQKLTPVGADEVLIADSAASFVNKRITLNSFLSPFGDGSDGDVTISTNTTLVRDMYYRNLTINSTIALDPNGYKIFVSETFTNNGIVRRNGNVGGTGTAIGGATGSIPAGAILNQGSLNSEITGGTSGVSNGAGGAHLGVAGTSSSPSYTTINGVAGGTSTGFYGSTSIGGSGGTSTRGSLYNVAYNSVQAICALTNPASFNLSATQYKGPSGSGGGGTDSSAGGVGWYGGGAGGNGGTIFICAKTINNTSGLIESKGGAGGAGGGSGSEGGGGGGGGQGGVVMLIYVTLTAIGTITLTGGTGGAKGGTGAATAGGNGNAGVVIQVPITI